MCGCCKPFDGPPYGIPLLRETVEQMPADVQKAWDVFDAWWHKQFKGAPVSRSTMTPEAKEALEKILASPIPGYDGVTCAESCYMVEVMELLVD
jgi:hypothetical protein